MPIDKPFAYHKPSDVGFDAIDRLRAAFSDVQRVIDEVCPVSRQRSIATTELETAAMWAIKAVVFNDPGSVVNMPSVEQILAGGDTPRDPALEPQSD